MSEKRFIWKCDDESCCIFDTKEEKVFFNIEVVDLLNEQDAKIKVLQNSWEIMNQRLSEKSKCDYKKAIIEYKKAIIEFCKFMNIDTPLLEVMVDEFLQEVF